MQRKGKMLRGEILEMAPGCLFGPLIPIYILRVDPFLYRKYVLIIVSFLKLRLPYLRPIKLFKYFTISGKEPLKTNLFSNTRKYREFDINQT